MQTIGERVRFARQQRGLHQWEVAEKARCSQANISGLENNRHAVSFYTIIDIATLLDVSIDWLAYGKEYKSENPVTVSACPARVIRFG